MKPILYKLSLIILFSYALIAITHCQTNPDDYRKGTIHEQLEQLEARTRIYDNYRAIREDIFQIVKKNVADSIKTSTVKTNTLLKEIESLKNQLDTTSNILVATQVSLAEMTRTKNSIGVIGLKLNKSIYNTSMWSILSILLLLLVIGYLIFKNNRNALLNQKKELVDLKKELEDYRQKKRIEIEKLNIEHFNEIKKLKGDSPKR
jgi:uncharacterized membrane-anchored protein YhcB (DUF1043 family)